MRKTWIVLKVVGVFVCLFIFMSNVRGIRTAGPEVNRVQAEVSQAWNNLEHAAPLLAKEYDRAIKTQQEVLAVYSSHNLWATFVAFSLAWLLTNLLWQFIVVPLPSAVEIETTPPTESELNAAHPTTSYTRYVL